MNFKQMYIQHFAYLLITIFIQLGLFNCQANGNANVAPILDVDTNSGYVGQISEKHVLVEVKPHLQVKNLENINGVCSYHVYKPNNEPFPFNIDIKDKNTGEAVIQLALESDPLKRQLDCSVKKFYKFFIEAHDCSEPSLASVKVPFTIEVIDHNDYKPQFDETDYYKTLVEDQIHENFLIVKARDQDCTNDGNACSYELIARGVDQSSELFPFRIDNSGSISTTKELKASVRKSYEFVVRAYDCANAEWFAETTVHIEVAPTCVPQWSNSDSQVSALSPQTNVFANLDLTKCDYMRCEVESVSTRVKLDLNSFPNGCEVEKCGEVLTKTELLSETDSDEKNEPKVYRSFNSQNDNVIKSNFDGNFGDSFILKTWIRRGGVASDTDLDSKEHVFCGTDSEAMNRHHYGLYFYRNSVKFLLRREMTTSGKNEDNKQFYPSLWEWSLDSIANDNKWHFYEIRFNYPKCSLFIDGKQFEENATNSDIIDAYELDMVPSTGVRSTHIGACFHARSKTFVNHFEGDVAGLSIYKKDSLKTIECIKNCKEYVEINMVGNELYLQSIENTQHDEITLKTNNVEDMLTLLRKITFINKFSANKRGKRYVNAQTELQCSKEKRTSSQLDDVIQMNDLKVEISVDKPKDEFILQLNGNRQIAISENEVHHGIKPFSNLDIIKIPINKVDSDSVELKDDNDESGDDDEEDVDDEGVAVDANSEEDSLTELSQCTIRFTPDSSEKFSYPEQITEAFDVNTQGDFIQISGVKTVDVYEVFLRNIVFSSDRSKGNKQFYLTCLRYEPNIETNTIVVHMNITSSKGYIAKKKFDKFVADDEFISSSLVGEKKSSKVSNPLALVVIVMSVGALGFLIVFTVFKLRMSRDGRRTIPNEENPQMEWDDSGLNIIENPMDIEANNLAKIRVDEIDGDEYSSEDDSIHDEMITEDEQEKVIQRDLEWDDTTIEINMKNEKISKSDFI